NGLCRDRRPLARQLNADNVISNLSSRRTRSSRGVRRSQRGEMGLKLAVVGGGSTYTPELVDGFSRRADRVQVDEIALLDIDPERLAIVGGLAERMLARQGWTGRVLQTTDRDAAIDGAD